MAGFSFSQLQEQAKEAGIGEPLPPGRYTVEAVETEALQSKASNKDMVKVKFSVLTGPHANRKVFNNYVVSPENNNALAFFFKHMAAFGLHSDFFAANPSMQQVASAMQGRVVDIDVKIKQYNGEDRNEVANTHPSSDSSARPSTPSDPFAAASNGASSAPAQPAAAPDSAPTPSTAAAPTDGELPPPPF